VDLKAATHIDSSGIGLLLDAMRRAKQRQARFILCGLNDAVRHVLERTRLNLLFEICPTFEEAVLDLEAAAC
jgi:anti-anti-sigma factor